MKTKHVNPKNDERGAIALLMAVALVALIGVASLAIDIGSALVTKAELQNVADAAALAGTREIGLWYSDPLYPERAGQISGTFTGASAVKAKALQYAYANRAGGINIVVPEADLLLGTTVEQDGVTVISGGTLQPSGNRVRGLRVTARREEGTNGVLETTLARVLGINEISARTSSAAALTPVRTLYGGEGDFPIGISKQWFASHKCNDSDTIQVLPTSNSSCAAWHVFTEQNHSASTMEEVLVGLRLAPGESERKNLNGNGKAQNCEVGTPAGENTNVCIGHFDTPETIAGVTQYNFNQGSVEARCEDMLELFNAKKIPQTPSGKMTAHVPVYDFSCGPVTGLDLIVGFVNAEIESVQCGADKARSGDDLINLKVKCGVISSGPGGEGEGPNSNDFGLLVSSPGMVQ